MHTVEGHSIYITSLVISLLGCIGRMVSYTYDFSLVFTNQYTEYTISKVNDVFRIHITTPKTNMTMENSNHLFRCISYYKNGDFPASHVNLLEAIDLHPPYKPNECPPENLMLERCIYFLYKRIVRFFRGRAVPSFSEHVYS